MKRHLLTLLTLSCLGLGIAVAQEKEYTTVYQQDFENEETYTDGWSVGANVTTTWADRSANKYLNLNNTSTSGNRTSSLTFPDYAHAEEYILTFDWGGYSSNWSSKNRYSTFTIKSGETALLQISFIGNNTKTLGATAEAEVTANGNSIGTLPVLMCYTGNRGSASTSIFHSFKITGSKESGTTITITKSNGDVITYTYATFYTVTSLEALTATTFGQQGFDNIIVEGYFADPIKLNAPTFDRVSYDSESTLSEFTFYTDLPLATINYIDGAGNSGAVTNGETAKIALGELKIWASAEGYINSDTVTTYVRLYTPEAEITGVNGTAREITMTQATGDSIYWYVGDDIENVNYYNEPIEVAEACTLKIYASNNNIKSDILEYQVAAGTYVKLNAPTFQRNNYNTASKLSDIVFYSDQTSVLCQPTATIYYMDGSGKQGTVANGETAKIALGDLKIWTAAEGYVNSDIITVNVHKAIEYQQVWQENFTGASGDVTLSADPVITISGTNYHAISDANGTFDERFLCADNYVWLANKGGLYSFTGGWRNICIRNVKAGQYVIFTGTNGYGEAYEINAVSSNITLDLLETQGESIVFQAAADGDCVFSVHRYNVFYTVGVYAEPHSHEMTPHAVSEGYLTFYNNDLDHMAPNSTKVYTVSKSTSEGWLTLTEVEDRHIPAGNAVIIQAQAGIPFSVESIDRTEETLENNILKGTETELVLENEEYVYVLSVDANKENVGFYKYTGKTLAAGKAYIDPADLDWTANGAPMLRIGAGMTAIEEIATEEAADQSTYDLLGRRVQAPAQGLYIRGGKKVWVK